MTKQYKEVFLGVGVVWVGYGFAGASAENLKIKLPHSPVASNSDEGQVNKTLAQLASSKKS